MAPEDDLSDITSGGMQEKKEKEGWFDRRRRGIGQFLILILLNS